MVQNGEKQRNKAIFTFERLQPGYDDVASQYTVVKIVNWFSFDQIIYY